MAKPLNEFGGWLRLLWLESVVGAIASFFVFIAFVVGGFIFLVSLEVNIALVVVARALFVLILFKLFGSIIRTLEQQSQDAANVIVTKLCRIIFVSLLMAVVGFFSQLF